MDGQIFNMIDVTNCFPIQSCLRVYSIGITITQFLNNGKTGVAIIFQ